MGDALWCLLLLAIVLCGLQLANFAYDKGLQNYISRKVGHCFAGVALFLAPVLFTASWWPLGLCAAFSVGFVAARFAAPGLLRGVGGTGRPEAVAELWYPIVCTLSVFVGWTWLGYPWLGVLPCLFLSFGDTATGVTRSLVYRREVKGWAGTAVMLAVCLALALLLTPYWLGAAMAVTATLAEKFTVTRPWIDDNLTLVVSSVVVGSLVYRFVL